LLLVILCVFEKWCGAVPCFVAAIKEQHMQKHCPRCSNIGNGVGINLLCPHVSGPLQICLDIQCVDISFDMSNFHFIVLHYMAFSQCAWWMFQHVRPGSIQRCEEAWVYLFSFSSHFVSILQSDTDSWAVDFRIVCQVDLDHLTLGLWNQTWFLGLGPMKLDWQWVALWVVCCQGCAGVLPHPFCQFAIDSDLVGTLAKLDPGLWRHVRFSVAVRFGPWNLALAFISINWQVIGRNTTNERLCWVSLAGCCENMFPCFWGCLGILVSAEGPIQVWEGWQEVTSGDRWQWW
jgi:hypothetical protein